MKKLLIDLLLVSALTFCVTLNAAAQERIVACGDDQVMVIDCEVSEGANVKREWEWKVSDAADLPAAYRNYMRSNDDCKPVDGNSKILVTSSSGGVVLIDRESKKSLFYAHVPNAHSAEYLPNNKIVVALSTSEGGNCIKLFDANKPEEVLYRDSLHSGHGVVWIQGIETLFALGGSELRAYSLEEWDTDQPKLKREKSWVLPGKSGHDLVSVSDNRLLVTTVDGVWNFDTRKETFSPFLGMEKVRDVKSINYDETTGRLIYTKAEDSWWTENIYFRNPDKVITLPGIKLYKVRVLE
jgi:Family of unknown function (DUF6528)